MIVVDLGERVAETRLPRAGADGAVPVPQDRIEFHEHAFAAAGTAGGHRHSTNARTADSIAAMTSRIRLTTGLRIT